jgi:hypothetical protein
MMEAGRPRRSARARAAWWATLLAAGAVLYFGPAAAARAWSARGLGAEGLALDAGAGGAYVDVEFGGGEASGRAALETARDALLTRAEFEAYVPPAPRSGAAAAREARAELARLNKLTVDGEDDAATERRAELLAARRAALATVLDSDAGVRRAWNARLAAAAPRGLVVCAGGAQPLVNAFVSLYVLHHTLNSTLPAALLHWGPAEVSGGTRAFFGVHLPSVRFIDIAEEYPEWHRPLSGAELGYQLKTLALYVAPFREVIMLDSDATPLQALAPLLDLPLVRRRGNLFWPDFWHDEPGVWDALGLHADDPWEHGIDPWEPAWDAPGAADREDGRPGGQFYKIEPGRQRQAESGLIVLDRARHWRVLEWALFLNTHSDLIYKLPGMLGDKDTFRAAFALAGAALEFRQSPHAPAMPLVDRRALGVAEDPRYRYMGIVQLHPDGSALFHHRTSWSKFPACAHHGELAGPITHISAPASHAQGRLYEWHAGLLDEHVRVVTCGPSGSCKGCSMRNLGALEETCGGRDYEAKQGDAAPVMAAAVARESYVWRASAAAAAAHELLPFHR